MQQKLKSKNELQPPPPPDNEQYIMEALASVQDPLSKTMQQQMEWHRSRGEHEMASILAKRLEEKKRDPNDPQGKLPV